jgi:hypothetical protein
MTQFQSVMGVGEVKSLRSWMIDPYEPGDYVKVEFPDPATGVGEWMWVRVARCDDEKQIAFGTLDSEPVGDYGAKG